jgi:hypothetical protein
MHRYAGVWAVAGAAAGSLMALGAGCEPELDVADYEAIAVGMPLDQVRALLGPGVKQMGRHYDSSKPIEEVASAAPLESAKPRLAVPTRETWTWHDAKGRAIVVTFVNGKAASKIEQKLVK